MAPLASLISELRFLQVLVGAFDKMLGFFDFARCLLT